MILAQPAWLWLLPVVVPLVLLLHVQRKRDLVVPSLVVWRDIKHSSTPTPNRRRLPWRDPNLWLQLLAVLLLAVGLAQPSVGTGSVSRWIVLLDASLTMSATDVQPTRFDAVLGRIADRWGRHPSGERVSLLFVGPRARLIAEDWPAGPELGSLLHDIEPTAGRADWLGAASYAASLAADEPAARVVVGTDAFGAAPALAALAEAGFPPDSIQMIRVGAGLVNAGVDEVVAEARPDRPSTWTVSGRVASIGLAARDVVQVVASYRPLGSSTYLRWAEVDVRIGPGGSAEFSIPLELPGPGEVQVRVIAGDDLPADDVASIVLRPEPVKVLVVGSAHPALLRALESYVGLETYTAASVPTEPETGQFDLVIVTDGGGPTPATSTLWLEAVPSSVTAGPEVRPSGHVLEVGPHHLTADLDAATLTVSRYQPLRLPAGAVPLLSSGESTLAWARSTTSGRQVAIGFSLEDSNWTSQVSFPAFLAAVIEWAAPRTWSHSPGGCMVGEACDWPREAFGSGWQLLDPAGNPVGGLPKPVTVTDDPLADAVWFGPGVDAGFTPRLAGTYTLELAGRSMPLPVVTTPLESGPTDGTDGARSRLERSPSAFWRWLAVMAAAAVAVESALSVVRTPRQVRWRSRAPLALSVLAFAALTAALVGVPAPGLGREYAVVWVGREAPPADALTDVKWYWVESHPSGRADQPAGASLAAGLPAALERALSIPRLSEHLRIVVSEEAGDSLTTAEAARLADAAAASQVRVDLVASTQAVEALTAADALPRIESVLVPDRVRAGSRFALEFQVAAPVGAGWQVEAALGSAVTEHLEGVPEPSALARATGVGTGRVEVELQAGGPGVLVYEVALRSDLRDDLAETTTVSVPVGPPPAILMVAADARRGTGLQSALRAQGIDLRRVAPSEMPWTLEGLEAFDGVVLVDVAARDLPSAYQALLERYVREHGGGLVIVGGSSAYGPGGYYATPLEEVSPLSSRVTDEVPQVAMTFVLDRSGSMSGNVAGSNRMDLAKVATLEAIGLLGDRSLASIVVFDTEAHVLLPLTPVADRAAFESALASVSPAGGTSIYPGLVAAYELMRDATSATRHVVVMTDGLSQEGDFAGILGALSQAGITTSFVGVGEAADRQQLTVLASLSNGTVHMARDFRALPSLLAQEALMLSSSPIEEGTVTPSWSAGVLPRFLEAASEMPAIDGYVRTTAKPETTVHAYVGDDPLLASWRYGLGRVAAYTSDADGPWSRAWMSTSGYAGAWAQLVRWAAERAVRDPWSLRIGQRGHVLDVVIDVPVETTASRPPVLPVVSVRVADRAGALSQRLEWVDDTRAAATIEVGDGYSGELTVSVAAVPDLGLPVGIERTVMWPLPPAPSLRWDVVRIRDLAVATGGEVYDTPEELEAYAGRRTLLLRHRPEVWLVLALAVFVCALAVRYGVASRLWAHFRPRWAARVDAAGVGQR